MKTVIGGSLLLALLFMGGKELLLQQETEPPDATDVAAETLTEEAYEPDATLLVRINWPQSFTGPYGQLHPDTIGILVLDQRGRPLPGWLVEWQAAGDDGARVIDLATGEEAPYLRSQSGPDGISWVLWRYGRGQHDPPATVRPLEGRAM